MIRWYLLGSLLFFGFFLNAQSDLRLHAYSNLHLFRTNWQPGFFHSPNNWMRFSGFSPALSIRPAGTKLYHEFSIQHIRYDRDRTETREYTRSGIGLGYELGAVLPHPAFEQLAFRLGGLARPFLFRETVSPRVVGVSEEDNMETGLSLGFVPHLEYALSPTFQLDLNLVYNLFQITFKQEGFNDPTLYKNQEVLNSMDVSFRKEWMLRFGLNIRLNRAIRIEPEESNTL